MTNAGELKFSQLQNSPEKKGEKGSFFNLSKSYLAPKWEESKNLETILLLLLFFYFYFSTL